MKVLFDINHPAHVHFFKYSIRNLIRQGHQVIVSSREKECATTLLEQMGVQQHVLSSDARSGVVALLKELCVRDYKLFLLVRKEKPDVMLSIGGTFIAHVGFMTGIPSLVFYDTENAILQNLITYPFAKKLLVPDCYQAWVPKHKTERYAGYHELAYLHPEYFEAEHSIALDAGLAPQGDTFFLRVVAWHANHDVGESGWSAELLSEIVHYLSNRGRVLVSSESKLPEELRSYQYVGNVADVHHLLAFCRLFVGESATMASECAVLGVPAIYAAQTGRGYTDEQEKKYGLVENVFQLDAQTICNAIEKMLSLDPAFYQSKRRYLLEETIDVSAFIREQIDQIVEGD